ncbi:hypothetical protein CBR_g38438 [Chara braunii]|uniref:Uncharacterized protein n=1 Tax=Chara braunii TaxID=69332 RepID=A0A388JNX3_CHABU|nr:hypothetical protein CBR_g38438 [Chara braunii]|eukprot:GBG59412.1 hypothetical protein CBR_g38438 [Chara braunii]
MSISPQTIIDSKSCSIDVDLGNAKRVASNNPQQSKVAEIGRSVVAVCQYVENEQQKRAAKEKRKADRKDAAEHLEVERREAELKERGKEEKYRREAERVETLKKEMDIKVAMQVDELRENVRAGIKHEIRDAISELCMAVTKEKQKQVYHESSDSESSASNTETKELSTTTRNLCIKEKRKRGEELVFEDNPLIKLPPKCTLIKASRPANLTTGFTRSKTRKTPSFIRKKKILALLEQSDV